MGVEVSKQDKKDKKEDGETDLLLSDDEESLEIIEVDYGAGVRSLGYSAIQRQSLPFDDSNLKRLIPGCKLRLSIQDTFIRNRRSWYTLELEHSCFRWSIQRRLRDFMHLHQHLQFYRTFLSIQIPDIKLERDEERRNSTVIFLTKKIPKVPSFPMSQTAFARREDFTWKMAALENYLENIIKIPCYREYHETLEFFEIGPFSFIEDLGTKGKEGFIKRRSNCGDNHLGMMCTAACGFWKKRWLFLKENFLALIAPSRGELECVLLLDKAFRTKSGRMRTGRSDVLVVQNLSRKLIVQCDSERQAIDWCEELCFVLDRGSADFVTPNRYESFAPPRSLSECKWIVDGATYFEAVALAMEAATEEIFIADWWLSPEIYLKRPTTHGHYWQLDYLLRRKARAGVKIYVLLYKELELALGINSYHTEQKLSKMHPNIQVLRHPYVSKGVLLWAHHEKIVCVDQTYAFTGGIDLCYGRWDDYQHRLTDLGDIEERVKVERHLSVSSRASSVSVATLRKTSSLPDLPDITRLDKEENENEKEGENEEEKDKGEKEQKQSKMFGKNGRFKRALEKYQARKLSKGENEEEKDKGEKERKQSKMFGENGRFKRAREKYQARKLSKGENEEEKDKKQSKMFGENGRFKRAREKYQARKLGKEENENEEEGENEEEKEQKQEYEEETSEGEKEQKQEYEEETSEGEKEQKQSKMFVENARFKRAFRKHQARKIFEGIKRRLSLEELGTEGTELSLMSEQPADIHRNVQEMALIHLGLERKFRLWHGKDYVNFISKDFQELDQPYSDMISRSTTPRMPWHDVGIYVQGMIARDIARHFILRWNHAKEENCPKDSSKPYLMPKCYSNLVETAPNILQDTVGTLYRAECQVLRSLCFWSGNIADTENSIHKAYVNVIRESKKFIYIENQFFISQPCGNANVYNGIADALFNRILRAHREKKDFRVYVVLPLLPAFEGEVGTGTGTLIQAITHWNYKSICRGTDSLKSRLSRHMKNPAKYIGFYGLRTHGLLDDKPVTELVYVHSKLLIADDQVAIIGSANINDRSLLGRRDSEIAVIVRDTNFLENPSGAGQFCYSLRSALFREHLGLMQQDDPQIDLRDPSRLDFFRNVWNEIAASNTKIYEEVFRCLPTDKVTAFVDLKKRLNSSNLANVEPYTAKQKLKEIRGYLVLFPLFFLCDERLEPHISTKEHYLPNSVFT